MSKFDDCPDDGPRMQMAKAAARYLENSFPRGLEFVLILSDDQGASSCSTLEVEETRRAIEMASRGLDKYPAARPPRS